jgi:tripartite-type tricarboxylate transporter receptor subunit TctC
MKLPRRKFLHLAAGAAALPSVSRIARAQDRPSRPVRIIVGFTAGSATDITARLFAQKLNEAWKTPVMVENIPGAGGSVGAERVAKSAPDGSTLYWGANGAMTINPSLQPSPAFEASQSCLCSRRPSPESCHLPLPASALPSTSLASYSRASLASTSSTFPIAARSSPM